MSGNAACDMYDKYTVDRLAGDHTGTTGDMHTPKAELSLISSATSSDMHIPK